MADSPDLFDDLLAWLDPDREIAGRKYEVIRAGLIRIFVSKGFSDAEDLADETIDRVMKRLPDFRETYSGDPVRYFHGVARNVIREAWRRKEITTDRFPEPITSREIQSDRHECLLKCLKFLTREKRELIVDYYLYQGHDKAAHHRRMAAERGITEGALRTRAYHIRAALQKSVLNCIKNLVK